MTSDIQCMEVFTNEEVSMEGERIYVDGSVSHFGSAYCIVISRGKRKKILKKLEEEHNCKYMEYFAILQGLRLGDKKSKIVSDCLNVINEINQNKLFNKDFEKMFQEIQSLIKQKECQLIWVNRKDNLAGYNLENRINKLKAYQESMFKIKRKRR